MRRWPRCGKCRRSVCPLRVVFTLLPTASPCNPPWQNPTNANIAFKIRTNAPKRYSVKPASGVLQAGGAATLAVTMAACSPQLLAQSAAQCLVGAALWGWLAAGAGCKA
jgi:hypothetical protein